jgi:F-type H+-transporting ATPase subunit gamma
MINLKSLRKRIGSIVSTQKITKAMQLVAANKLTKAQELFIENNAILQTISKVSNQVFLSSLQKEGSLLKHDQNSKLFVLVTSDKGLCGGYNSAIIKKFNKELERLKNSNDIKLILIGKKAKSYYKNFKDALVYDNVAKDHEYLADIVATKIIETIVAKHCNVTICYNHFKNAISYDTMTKLIWPFATELVEGSLYESSFCETLEVEPQSILKLYIKISLLNALLVGNASELSARMTSMDSATKNSETLIEQLTLKLNRNRQAMITKELIEIISGAEAL